MSTVPAALAFIDPGLPPHNPVLGNRALAGRSAAFVVLAHAGAAWLIWSVPGVPMRVPPEPLAVRLVEAPAPDVLPKPLPAAPRMPEPPRKAPPTPVRRNAPAPAAAAAPVPILAAETPPKTADEPVAAVAPARADPIPAVVPQAAAEAPASRPVAAEPVAAPKLVAPRFDAAYLSNPPPAYPPLSRRLGEEGKVVLRVFVEPDGQPAQVEVRTSSGHARLDDAALGAVRRWRFVPARRGEAAVAAWVLVPLNFTLNTF
jgi:protein TonB